MLKRKNVLRTRTCGRYMMANPNFIRVVRAIMAYEIDPTKCNECTKCLAECTMEAIVVSGQGNYSIAPEICTDCGSCADVCCEEAIRGG